MGFETRFTIEWGDCDAAGIVFYPNYFYWIDCTYQRWLRHVGLSQRELTRRFGAVTPLVEAGARFLLPSRDNDELLVEAQVAEWSERRFRIAYRLDVEGRTVSEGFEARAWATRTADGGLQGATIASEFRDLMT
jgi:acyl-CoA thioesterase FadM